ncbi:MAG TPA: anion permease [Shinella sp.]|jgi:PiT family inorganic phosphate transporter|uniref:inorganic phosphate transporter n=1 Tax=Shinella sp. TaxID=1870904 RepID=UPI0029BA8BF3|nr:inorganic phosphate transporter [Shinella sp.]MDX3972671.1 inorganic phosphate transporter [Shinella sp.]HEV7245697.1 anion permease [Shinella sp.]
MANSQVQRGKPTLDKDLEKFTFTEQATHFVLKSWTGVGISLVFLLITMAVADSFATGTPGVLVIAVTAALAAYMAMNIGANDVTNNVGAAVGARAMSMGTALVIAAIFEIAGALLAGQGVAATVASGIVDPAIFPSPEVFAWAMMAALVSAALWINIATLANAPISTTHAIIGGVIGAGAAATGFHSVQWDAIAVIVVSWTVSPILGGVIAALFLYFIKEFIIYREDKIAAAKTWVPVLVALMAGAFAAFIANGGTNGFYHVPIGRALVVGLVFGIITYAVTRPIIRRHAEGLDNRNQSLRTLFRLPLICSAALLSFAHGANDVSNAVGPLYGVVSALRSGSAGANGLIPLWVMVIGAFGISLGLLLFGPRLIRIVGSEITKLNPMRAFCVALSSAVAVLTASAFAIPVSSTHIAVGAVFGVGLFREWYTRNSQRRIDYIRNRGNGIAPEEPPANLDETRRRYLVRRSHFMTIVSAWIVTLPVSAILSAVVFLILNALFT